jgi:hypothetical protein
MTPKIWASIKAIRAISHQFAQRQTAIRWLEWLHRKLSIVLPEPVPIRKGKGKGKAKAKQDSRITITRELKVNEIVDLSILPSTFPVPHHPTALLIDLSKVERHLTNASGKRSTLDAYIRSEVSYLPCQSTAVLTNPIRTRTLIGESQG